jgi:hypothetical protein
VSLFAPPPPLDALPPPAALEPPPAPPPDADASLRHSPATHAERGAHTAHSLP